MDYAGRGEELGLEVISSCDETRLCSCIYLATRPVTCNLYFKKLSFDLLLSKLYPHVLLSAFQGFSSFHFTCLMGNTCSTDGE